ncbi:hypothetical protein GCM10011385_33580 [Nitratireductor aestuarii]|uniref:Tripartite tricarboxylate transporter substrate binding protein n=1 Tax=Nitratireductor aestuarii TaxID=1735103 RepID=A0A916RYM7_9HYPH|nr:tripartite tricarboxylate transporter substrate binding protein [Nitratireductor aestuarii]GGA76799.1 hypothetical protein GCM10011385_33580 [Nitratireductor aestuarii]
MNRFFKMAASFAATLSLAAALAGPAAAQDFPSKAITIVAPFPPGALTDILVRTLQPKMEEKLGQSILIDNRAGAGGTVGTALVSRAKPDGYTLLITINAPIVMAPTLQKSVTYDPTKDLRGIAKLGETYLSLVAQKSSPFNSVADVIAAAKEKPGQLTFASAGIGSAHHIAGELLNRSAGIQLKHVPFQGGAPAMQALVGGQVDFAFAGLPTAHALVEAGELKFVALAEKARIPSHPDLPTINETAEGVETSSWMGFFAPAGTPDEVVEKLSAAALEALAEEDVQASMRKMGLEPTPSSPAELDKLIADDLAFWTNAVEIAGIEKQ